MILLGSAVTKGTDCPTAMAPSIEGALKSSKLDGHGPRRLSFFNCKGGSIRLPRNRKASTMSPQVDNFVHSLVEMAKAQETLPQVQAELEHANTQIEEYAKQVQRLEMIAVERKSELDNLYSRIRSLEVERDDASFRELEAEDKAHTALNRLRAIQTALGQTVDALEPPKPQPEPVIERAADPTENVPTTDHTQASASTASNSSEPAPYDAGHTSQGQGEGNPTAPLTEEGSQTVSSATTTASVEPSKPYTDRLYVNTPGWVSREDWRNGGGTDESYDWRHSSPTLPEGITSRTA